MFSSDAAAFEGQSKGLQIAALIFQGGILLTLLGTTFLIDLGPIALI